MLLALAGCAATDPLYRSGLWHPVAANDRNLRMMVVDPQDLDNGVPLSPADGGMAADAVARYRAGKAKPLPDSGLAQISVTGSGAAPAAPN